MADVSDPQINEAYENVRSDKSPINWLLVDYVDEKSSKLTLTATGEGGLEEFKSKLDDSKGSYGYVRIEYANDEESKRSKFILVTWIGPSVRVMRKARMGVHISDIKQVLRQYSLDVAASSHDDLQQDPIVIRLRKAGGASYDKV